MLSMEEIKKLKNFYRGIRYLLRKELILVKAYIKLSRENYQLKLVIKQFKQALLKKNNKS